MKNMTHTYIIIFGITGDLAKRQLLPALYYVTANDPFTASSVIGISQHASDAKTVWAQAEPFIATADAARLAAMVSRMQLLQGDAHDASTYQQLKQLLVQQEAVFGQGNVLIYCAVPSTLFDIITAGCARVGIIAKQMPHAMPWHRIVYEKPFGHDLISARALNAALAQQVNECQIFRIDHFLTKEVVSNIALIRFTNIVFEPLWNHRFIDQIHIIAAESVGVEGRGAYYDAYGVLRDMMQNHLLQLTALIGMETPVKLIGDAIRDERLKVLKALRCDDGLLGQYKGYTGEPHVMPNSQTETFALLKCTINTPRWQGVPFYLMTGKRLACKETVMYIKFKAVDCLLTRQCPPPANWLTIRVAPEGIFALTLNGKDPATADGITPIEMSFCHSCEFETRATQAYEQALAGVLRGDQAAAVRFDEIEASWQFIDTVYAKKLPLDVYDPGTVGPESLEHFVQKHGIWWQ